MTLKRILVFNVNWLGDVIFSSAVFHRLREEFPEAHIACMAPQRVQQIVQAIQDIDQFIPFDERTVHRSLWMKWQVIRKLRAEKFDAAFLLHGSATRAAVTYFAGIPIRVGYATKNRQRFLTHSGEEPHGQTHRADYYLGALRLYGLDAGNPVITLSVKEDDLNRARHLLRHLNISDDKKLLIVHPGGNWNLKRWPARSYAMLIRKLQMLDDAHVIITGAKTDRELAQSIQNELPRSVPVLAGQTSIGEALALIKLANLIICGDTGPLHMANAVGTKAVGIFGPTRPEVTGPRGQGPVKILQEDVGCNRQPCYLLSCPENVCMSSITVNHVWKAIQDLGY